MTVPHPTIAEPNTDLIRAAETVAAKLRARGIDVSSDDTPADIVAMLESVEMFENAVRLAGGDLMMDEAPVGSTPQPDDPRFALPVRRKGEPVATYVDRLSGAIDGVNNSAE